MNSLIFLSVDNSIKWWEPSYKCFECGNFKKVIIKNTVRSIKKVKNIFCGETVVITCGHEGGKLSDFVKEYREITLEGVLPVLNTVCRQTAEKNGIGIPFKDCYIEASPQIARRIIEKIHALSRIFTVISDESATGEIYDGIYFKHGVPVRQLPSLNNNITKESVFIRANGDACPIWAEIPVVDLSSMPIDEKKTVDIRRVYIKNKKTQDAALLWGGKGSVVFCTLLGETPDYNDAVNIAETADKIFLLDTEEI